MKIVEDIWLDSLLISKFRTFIEFDISRAGIIKRTCEWCIDRFGENTCASSVADRLGAWSFGNPEGVWDYAFNWDRNIMILALTDNDVAAVMAVEFKLTHDGSFIRLVEI